MRLLRQSRTTKPLPWPIDSWTCTAYIGLRSKGNAKSVRWRAGKKILHRMSISAHRRSTYLCGENSVLKRSKHEPGPCSRRYAQRGIYSYVGRQAGEVGGERSSLRRLGDLSHEGFACRPEPDLCIANERVVRSDHPAIRRRRQDLAPARNTSRRTEHDSAGD